MKQPANPLASADVRQDAGTIVFRHGGIESLRRTRSPESLSDYIAGVQDTLLSLAGPGGTIPWRIVIETGDERTY